MSNLELPNRSLAVIITEAGVCLTLTIISITGNSLICLAVYRNPNLRSTTNLYIIALAVSDLLCATVEMSLGSAVLIIGRWDFGDALCQIQGFVDVFSSYVTPAILGLTAFNRYIRIVKTNYYNKIFSPRRSKIWLSCVWLSLALYLLVGRVTKWSSFEFIPGYAVCSVAFTKTESRIVHYCIVLGLLFVFPFCAGVYSYYKIFCKTHQHQQNVVPSLQNTINNGSLRNSVREINVSRALFYVAAGFLACWIPMWALVLWMRFSPETCPRIAVLLAIYFFYLSASINPFIYTFTNGDFRREFRKLLHCGKVARIVPLEAAAAVENKVEEQEDEANV